MEVCLVICPDLKGREIIKRKGRRNDQIIQKGITTEKIIKL